MCWAAGSNFRTDHDWENLIRAALYSAKVNTTLEPVIVIDGEPSAFTEELKAAGAEVIFHKLSFQDALEQHYAGRGQNLHVYTGAFLRFDIPLIETRADYVLYTDCDVLFLTNPEFLPEEMPRYFAAAPQALPDDVADMNSGVMLINISNMRASHPQLLEFTKTHLHLGLDQEILRAAYANTATQLRPELNWKPYWGLNGKAVILHWHGPKPITVRNYLQNPEFSSHADWNALFQRNPEGYLQAERLYGDLLLGARAAAAQDETGFLRLTVPGRDPFWGEYFAHLAALNQIVRQSGAPLERSIFFEHQMEPSLAPRFELVEKRRNFAFFAMLGTAMLELGFNAGHSALLALTANKNLSYVAIDPLAHPYARPCFDYLRSVFGNRIKLIAGDPKTILEQFSTSGFDLASIDGAHDFPTLQSELAELCRILPPASTILLNEASHPPARAALLGAIAAKRLKIFATPLPPADQIFLEVTSCLPPGR